MNKLKKLFKYLIGFLFFSLILGYFSFYYFTKPKSDEKILSEFKALGIKPELTYETFRGFTYRKVKITNDKHLPTMVFVHGTIGSSVDFIGYMSDSVLAKKTNFISYDRVGYNYDDEYKTQASIAFERDLLQSITKDLDHQKTIVVGYSYGGPIALADTNDYKKTILIAPAVYYKVEPEFWFVNIYKWSLTRWLVPNIWKQAGKEKLTHKEDLQKFDNIWTENKNDIISIHGTADVIVPFSNSEYLLEQFPEKQFNLVKIPRAKHFLIWEDFDIIKEQFIKSLD
jgi:pimeloyl-ACP methyl ester carboxylesterase